jgi:aryl-alcohol dehydrogenase-like predicted oxidoreductase
MEYRNLGRSGLQVSTVGVGCNNFGMRIDMTATQAVVDKAIDLGINLFDTADVYGGAGKSEEFLGKALGSRRHDVVVATKFGMKMGEGPYGSGASRKYIMAACEASLRRLGTDYIDLYQIHTPDPKTPVDETLRALDDLVRAGKVRYIGHSNFSGWQTAETHYLAEKHGVTPFISAQNEYSLVVRDIEKELAPACLKYGVGLLPYFPLASGFLTGKYKAGEEAPAGTRFGEWFKGPYGARTLNERNFGILAKLEAFAGARSHTVLDLAMSWLACKPFVGSVIAGATKPEQVEQNASAASWKLTAEEMAEVDGLAK